MIPQGRLSTIPVQTGYLPPDEELFTPLNSHERGPIAIEDTTEGLRYQNWQFIYDENTGEITATPETSGSPVLLSNVLPNLTYLTCTFDQNARVSLTYTNDVSSYLYWYDTSLGYTVTTDLGSDVITPSLLLDDKRATQLNTNDMLLWYTKDMGGVYNLYMKIQRERFMNEYLMKSNMQYGNKSYVSISPSLGEGTLTLA